MGIYLQLGQFNKNGLIDGRGPEGLELGDNFASVGEELCCILGTSSAQSIHGMWLYVSAGPSGPIERWHPRPHIDPRIRDRIRAWFNLGDEDEGHTITQEDLKEVQSILSLFLEIYPSPKRKDETTYGTPEYYVAFCHALLLWLEYWLTYSIEHYKAPQFRWG